MATEPRDTIKETVDDLTPQEDHLGATEDAGGNDLVKLQPPMAEGTEGEEILEDPREALTPG